MGGIKEIKCLAAKTAFSSENNKPVTVLALVESSRKKVKIAKDYKLMSGGGQGGDNLPLPVPRS